MKKVLLVFMLFAFSVCFAENSQASNYKLNDATVDALFNAAGEGNFATAEALLPGASSLSSAKVKGKDPLVAIVLDFFVGGLGIHRFYLGTETMTGIGYILTCGGIFGLVPLIDLIVLAVNFDDISQFVDNPKFFMW